VLLRNVVCASRADTASAGLEPDAIDQRTLDCDQHNID
jgi:hypothetical protein